MNNFKIKFYSRKLITCLLCILGIWSFSSCNEVGKRDLKKILDANLHSGELKGYSHVYIIDTQNYTYECDDNPDEPLLQYPIYKHDDGTYTIEYSDGEYTLHLVDEPLDLFGTGYTLLWWRFKEADSNRYHYYIEEIPHYDGEKHVLDSSGEDYEMVIDDSVEEDNNPSDDISFTADFFNGKTYIGEGNGGGNVTNLTITFMDDGECEGTSDWYQAFEEPTTFLGTYKMKGERLFVLFHIDKTTYNEDGYDVDFDFEISEYGEYLSHDKTDYSQEGSMWNDYMVLKILTDVGEE